MSDSQEQIKLKDQITIKQELKQSRRSKDDQGLSTRNFLKKMTAKKGQAGQQKAQNKITRYMNLSSSLSQPTNQGTVTMLPSSQQQRIRELQQRMKQKDLQIQKMKRNQVSQQHKLSQLFIQNKEYKRKSRHAMASSMLQAAHCRRIQKKQIDPKLGYFKDNGKVFVQGSVILNLKNKINHKQQAIKLLQEQKKTKDTQRRERAIFRIQFINKEIGGLQRELAERQSICNTYKEQLKLADKQENTQYAQQGWPIVYDQYQTLQLLGKGGFGQVYKVFDLQSSKIVALKVNRFNNQDPAQQQDFTKHVQRESQIMSQLDHPHIGKFIKLLQNTASKVTFTLQYCTGPQLSLYLRKHGCLQQKECKQIIRQILCALNYLSNLKQKIIHYDLKPGNIMFHHGQVKILDFGLCKPMGNGDSKIELTSQGIGTYYYLSPECFGEDQPEISTKVDVWSTGVIFYQLLYGRKPFGHGLTQNRIYNQGIILNAHKVEFEKQTPKKHKVSEQAKNFIRQCLAYDPAQRLSPSQAYEHEYFKK